MRVKPRDACRFAVVFDEAPYRIAPARHVTHAPTFFTERGRGSCPRRQPCPVGSPVTGAEAALLRSLARAEQ